MCYGTVLFLQCSKTCSVLPNVQLGQTLKQYLLLIKGNKLGSLFCKSEDLICPYCIDFFCVCLHTHTHIQGPEKHSLYFCKSNNLFKDTENLPLKGFLVSLYKVNGSFTQFLLVYFILLKSLLGLLFDLGNLSECLQNYLCIFLY